MDTMTSVMLPNVAFNRPPTEHSPKVVRIWRSGRTKRKGEMASHTVATWAGLHIFCDAQWQTVVRMGAFAALVIRVGVSAVCTVCTVHGLDMVE